MEAADAAPAGVSVVQHIATVAALQLSMQAHEREMLRREGAETLAEMLRGALDTAVVARRLAIHGFPPDARLVLAIVRPENAGADGDAVADTLAHGRFPRLVLRQEEELYVLIPDDRAARAALAGRHHGRGPACRSGPDHPCGWPGVRRSGPSPVPWNRAGTWSATVTTARDGG